MAQVWVAMRWFIYNRLWHTTSGGLMRGTMFADFFEEKKTESRLQSVIQIFNTAGSQNLGSSGWMSGSHPGGWQSTLAPDGSTTSLAITTFHFLSPLFFLLANNVSSVKKVQFFSQIHFRVITLVKHLLAAMMFCLGAVSSRINPLSKDQPSAMLSCMHGKRRRLTFKKKNLDVFETSEGFEVQRFSTGFSVGKGFLLGSCPP